MNHKERQREEFCSRNHRRNAVVAWRHPRDFSPRNRRASTEDTQTYLPLRLLDTLNDCRDAAFHFSVEVLDLEALISSLLKDLRKVFRL